MRFIVTDTCIGAESHADLQTHSLAQSRMHWPFVRDLKPENILMDGSGNLKLADLGFAKLVFEGGRAYTVCGTPDYLAPEVIEHRGATRGSDYWALGILIFEFISGRVACWCTHVS